jgi:hypothetical protein
MNLLASGLSRDNKRTILQGKGTGGWLSVLPSTVNSTKLSAQEFRDNVLLHYARSLPADLPSECDGCNAMFSIRHVLECKKSSLVIICHNEMRVRLVDLASKVFFPFRSSRPTKNTFMPRY